MGLLKSNEMRILLGYLLFLCGTVNHKAKYVNIINQRSPDGLMLSRPPNKQQVPVRFRATSDSLRPSNGTVNRGSLYLI
jgi:hypothetical protein